MIIAITGTHGAGKGALLEYFLGLGFKAFSMSGFITKEVIARGLPLVRDSTRLVANDMRSRFGPQYIAEIGYKTALSDGGNYIIEALRCPGEADYLLQHGVRLIGIDADPFIRYERTIKRGEEKDMRELHEFLSEEQRESTGIELWDMNIPACIKKAEKVFSNDGDIEDLHLQIRRWFSQVYR